MNNRLVLICLAMLVLLPFFGKAQFSANNLAESQLGDVPGADPQYLHSIYDQLNMEYTWKKFSVSGRLENYYSGDSLRDHYTKITQYSLAYNNKGLKLRAGNYYETLGKGLLFRGYEIKGSVYEDRVYRVKQGFYRDALGFSGAYSNSWMELKALRGKSLVNQLPPGAPDRRPDLLTAAEARFKAFDQWLGAIWLKLDNSQQQSDFLSLEAAGPIIKNLDYSLELAQRVAGGESLFSFGGENAWGFYLNLGYSQPGLGVSVEWKDYHQFFIGSGISDPPTLVKEHSYKLLNRSTHIPYLIDESGYQVEVFALPVEGHLLTFNHSRSKNQLAGSDYISGEYFADWQFPIHEKNQLKIFLDYSWDELLFEHDRYASGLYFTRMLNGGWNCSLETEAQRIERTFADAEVLWNVYGALIVSRSTRFSAAFVLEFTNDSKYADLPGTDEVENRQFYPGVNCSFKPDRRNTMQLFVGKRRGGPACTSGICYEVLDFKGLEMRWLVRI